MLKTLEATVWMELTRSKMPGSYWPTLRVLLRKRQPEHKQGVVRVAIKLVVPESVFELPIVNKSVVITEGMINAQGLSIEAEPKQ